MFEPGSERFSWGLRAPVGVRAVPGASAVSPARRTEAMTGLNETSVTMDGSAAGPATSAGTVRGVVGHATLMRGGSRNGVSASGFAVASAGLAVPAVSATSTASTGLGDADCAGRAGAAASVGVVFRASSPTVPAGRFATAGRAVFVDGGLIALCTRT